MSTLPSAHGERAVLRLLDKSESKLSLESVGMQGEVLQRFERLILQPHGIILVTGPTGSWQDDHAVRRTAAPGRDAKQHHDSRGPD